MIPNADLLLREIAAINPWTGAYDEDWCHFCNGHADGEGHEESCLWLRVRNACEANSCKKCGSRLGPEYHELAGTYLDQIKLFFRDCPNHGQRLVRSVNAWR